MSLEKLAMMLDDEIISQTVWKSLIFWATTQDSANRQA